MEGPKETNGVFLWPTSKEEKIISKKINSLEQNLSILRSLAIQVARLGGLKGHEWPPGHSLPRSTPAGPIKVQQYQKGALPVNRVIKWMNLGPDCCIHKVAPFSFQFFCHRFTQFPTMLTNTALTDIVSVVSQCCWLTCCCGSHTCCCRCRKAPQKWQIVSLNGHQRSAPVETSPIICFRPPKCCVPRGLKVLHNSHCLVMICSVIFAGFFFYSTQLPKLQWTGKLEWQDNYALCCPFMQKTRENTFFHFKR